MDKSTTRPIPPYVHYLALALASVALFWGTTTAYYHFQRMGTALEMTPLRRAVVSVHDFLGVWGVIVLAVFPFLWPVIFFFRERIGGLWLKAFGWICAAGFTSILAGVLGGASSGGSFGALVGGKLHAAMGQGLAAVICISALGMALFLATERFFSLPASPRFEPEAAAVAAPAAPAVVESGVGLEESKEIAEEPRFDLEKVLEIEEKKPPLAAVEPPPAPMPLASAPPAPLEIVQPDPLPAPAVESSQPVVIEEEPAPLPPPPPPVVEERAAQLEEAVERATKDFVLPAPPPVPATPPAVPEPSASSGMLDNAARLVIQEGRASVSLLQRRLSIPFSRASLLLDLLEKEGVIGPYKGGPARDILLSLADWEQKQNSGSPDPLPQA